jgi:hypothetical protein
MKMEWKLSDFSVEKQKWNKKYGNGNGIFLVEAEKKTEQRFPVEQTRKWNFRFRLMRNFCFQMILHGQSSKPNT